MTTDGFFSAVEDRDDETAVFVRARAREDAQRLADALDEAVIETPDADYRFRVHLSKEAWSSYVADCAAGIDRQLQGRGRRAQGPERARVYGDVWSTLLRLQEP